jgi:hypothetical protein
MPETGTSETGTGTTTEGTESTSSTEDPQSTGSEEVNPWLTTTSSRAPTTQALDPRAGVDEAMLTNLTTQSAVLSLFPASRSSDQPDPVPGACRRCRPRTS